MKAIFGCLTVALIPSTIPARAQVQLLNCPAGTYLSIDQFGKPVCLQSDNNTPAIIQPSPTIACANGTYPSVDNDGNRVCKSVDQRGPTYYSAPTNNGRPKACPTGTFPAGLDISGNQICRQG
jgi:hypothetical protein